MLQRNDTGVVATLPTVHPISDVQPGGVIDLPELLPGFSKVLKKDAPDEVIHADVEDEPEGTPEKVVKARPHRARS